MPYYPKPSAGSSATGDKIVSGNFTASANTNSHLVSFISSSTEKAYVNKDGGGYFGALTIISGSDGMLTFGTSSAYFGGTPHFALGDNISPNSRYAFRTDGNSSRFILTENENDGSSMRLGLGAVSGSALYMRAGDSDGTGDVYLYGACVVAGNQGQFYCYAKQSSSYFSANSTMGNGVYLGSDISPAGLPIGMPNTGSWLMLNDTQGSYGVVGMSNDNTGTLELRAATMSLSASNHEFVLSSSGTRLADVPVMGLPGVDNIAEFKSGGTVLGRIYENGTFSFYRTGSVHLLSTNAGETGELGGHLVVMTSNSNGNHSKGEFWETGVRFFPAASGANYKASYEAYAPATNNNFGNSALINGGSDGQGIGLVTSCARVGVGNGAGNNTTGSNLFAVYSGSNVNAVPVFAVGPTGSVWANNISGVRGDFTSLYVNGVAPGGGGVTIANNNSNAYYYPVFATASTGLNGVLGVTTQSAGGHGLIFDPYNGSHPLLGIGKNPTYSVDVSGNYISVEQTLASYGGYVWQVTGSTSWVFYRQAGSNDLSLYEGGAVNLDRVVFKQGGNVGIGTTAPVALLHVSGVGGGISMGAASDASTATPISMSLGGTYYNTTGGSQPKLKLYDAGGTSWYGLGIESSFLWNSVASGGGYKWYVANVEKVRIDTNGNVSGTDFVVTSDARIKSQVRSIYGALDTVAQLRGVTFVKNGETNRKMGVIAQEVRPYAPEVVGEGEDGMLNVMYGNMAGLFIEAIKDLKKENDELKKRLSDIERRMG